MGKWCVIADNGDEIWVYGPIEDIREAEELRDKLENATSNEMGIEYEIGMLHPAKDAVQ